MSKKSIVIFLLSGLLAAAPASASPGSVKFREAVNLYRQGMYESARTLFESLGDDPVSRGYAVLCAGKMGTVDYQLLLELYEKQYGKSSFYSQHHYLSGLHLFDAAKYAEALEEFQKAERKELGRSEQSQYVFKRGFCSYALGQYPEARKWLIQLEDMPKCDYTAPSRFALGFMCYTQKDFDEAIRFLELSVKDKRLEDLSAFYLVDCRFMKKDYAYVTDKGTAIFDRMLAERQIHLARIISESFLILGDEARAKEYFDKSAFLQGQRTDADFFYAGSLMYALRDYKGAIDNFTQIKDRSDSLGQIASYQLANSYIQQRDKVAALEAFREASELDFDLQIKEDAYFNRAKLAFDINADGTWFENYLKKYNTSVKGEQVYAYMALARLVNRDYEGAIDAYDKLSSTDSEQDLNYLKANYLRAVELIKAGAYKDAVSYLESATVGLSPNDPFCQLSKYWIAECAYRTGDYDKAHSGFSALYNLSALDSQIEGIILPYNIAYCSFNKGDYDNAARWFDRYCVDRTAQNRIDALTRRADCDFARKDYKAAVESYRKVIDAAGLDGGIYPYYQQALAYGLQGKKFKKNQAAVLEGLRSLPSDTPMYSAAMYELGRCYLDMGNNDKAAEVFRYIRRTTSEPRYVANSLIGLGMACTNVRDYDSALASYKEVVALMPGTEYASNSLSAIESLYQTMGRPGLYLEYLEENHLNDGKSESDKDDLYFNVAKQTYLAGDFPEALKCLQAYVDAFPQGRNLGPAWYYIGECWYQAGQKEKAREAFATVMDQQGEGSYRELSAVKFARVSLDLQHWQDAYGAYEYIGQNAKFPEHREEAAVGMMRAAYGLRNYDVAIQCADAVGDNAESNYIRAKSYLATSRRPQALAYLKKLAASPSTREGAEATYLLIQDAYDRGQFDKVPDMTYDFAPKAGQQNYWLARSFITLADSFVEQGNIKQACATLESLLENYVPESESDDIRVTVNDKLNALENQKK